MRLFEHFFQIVAPDECIVCGIEGSLLCSSCSERSLQVIPERCYRCYALSQGCKTCAACRHSSVLKHVWVRSGYTPSARRVVHELKFNFNRSAARLIAKEIAALLPVLPKDTVIVHVPAATSRIRQRGFDQSALIARELSHFTRLPHMHALARHGQQRQVGASASLRRTQMSAAFRCVSPHVVRDAHILLVDDVLTTGSTLEAAGLELKRNGAKTVSATVFAQAK